MKVTDLAQNNKALHYIRCTGILFLCIVVNYLGRKLSSAFSLPGWLDSFGTVFAAYSMGPIPGAIVGASSNIIYSFWNPVLSAYSIVSVFIALGVGYTARKGWFETVFHSMNAAGGLTIISVVLSSLLNFFLNDGNTGNLWSDGVRDYFVENGMNKVLAMFVGEFYLEFPDKLVTVMLLYLTIKLGRFIRKNKERSHTTETAAALAVVFTAGIFLQCLSPMKAEALQREDVSYIHTIYNGSNGLVCGHANAVVQTNDGILWVGTYAGLYRYNGSVFEHMDDFDAVRNVNCLYVDDEGRLWVGTNDHGVVLVINEKIANVIDSSEGLPSDSIRSIVQCSSGEYYIGTTDGIAIVELNNGIDITSVISEAGYISHLTADKLDHVAAVNNEGSLMIYENGEQITVFDPSQSGSKISSCNFSGSILYAGTTEGLVSEYKLEGKKLNIQRSTKCKGIMKINNVYPRSGVIWVCADDGVGYINYHREFIKQETGEFDRSVENMAEDYQGNLWFASSRLGLLRMIPSPVSDILAEVGLDPCVVNTCAVYGSQLYIGSDEGLIIVDTVKHTVLYNELTDKLKSARIRCITGDSNGDIWICSYGSGLVCLKHSGKIIDYSGKDSEIGTRVRMCYELSDKTMAVSCSGGLYFIKGGKIEDSIPYSDEFGHAQVLCMLEDEDGTLYAGTDGNGIAVIKDHKPVKFIKREDGLSSGVVLRIVKDPEDGSLYIVTSNSICRMTDENVYMLEAFPYSNNYDVILDDDGQIFVPGSSGIYVMDKHKLINGDASDYLLLDSSRGFLGSLTANAYNCMDSQKNMYISSDRGVYKVNLDDFHRIQRSFRIIVPNIKIDENTFPIDRTSPLEVARNSAKIEIIPEIINYTLDDPIVGYKLEGFDNEWNYVKKSELTAISYTNLVPGDYTFRLAIFDDAGEIIEESDYALHKEMAIYDNAWFRYYMIVVAFIFIGWLTWFITRTQMDHTLQLQQAKLDIALQQNQMSNETILAIAKTVDAKDVRTSKHSQRVSEYSGMIAKEYGFSEEEQENLKKAALLHDIGKIGIPDAVLNKPSRLTDEEYAVMKSHVTHGAEILKDFTFIDHVVEGAKYHHERYDGRGYPDGLKGEEIPLYGRIISIADAFDAMTANRVYRKSQDFDYVLGELKKGRGTQFDPELLDIFLKLLDNKTIDIEKLYKAVAEENVQEEAK